MKKVLVMSLLALVVMTMSSCLRVKIDGKDWNFGGHTNDTPTQVHQVGEVTHGVDVTVEITVHMWQVRSMLSLSKARVTVCVSRALLSSLAR